MSTSAERVHELRARRKAAGLRADGKPRKPRPRRKSPGEPRERVYGMSPEAAKALGLESIAWMAQTRPQVLRYYRGVYARATRLPPEWWLERMSLPIAALAVAVEGALPLSQAMLTLKIEGE